MAKKAGLDGICGEAKGDPCGGYACDEQGGCKSGPCASDADCHEDYACVNAACVPDEGLTCDGGFTMKDALDHEIDCWPYRCTPESTRCPETCANHDDCDKAGGYLCEDNHCLRDSGEERAVGCECRTGHHGGAGWTAGLGGALLLCLRRCARRKEKRS